MNAHTFEKVKIEAVEVLIEVRITENRLSNPIKLIKSIKYPSVHQHWTKCGIFLRYHPNDPQAHFEKRIQTKSQNQIESENKKT